MTLEDSADRRRYLNSRATLETLLSLGVVPIVNENDTVATDEIRYGDNDRLAAQVAVTVGADQLVLLSDVDGFYSANPNDDPHAHRYDVIDDITPEIEAMAGDAGSGLSKGGMKTKLMAAKTATAAGCAMAITEGSVLNPLTALENGAPATWFTAKLDPQVGAQALDLRDEAARRRCISMRVRPMRSAGPLAAARRACPRRGQSSAAAIPWRSARRTGGCSAHGLARYTSGEARRIAGRRSAEIEEALGYAGRAVLSTATTWRSDRLRIPPKGRDMKDLDDIPQLMDDIGRRAQGGRCRAGLCRTGGQGTAR